MIEKEGEREIKSEGKEVEALINKEGKKGKGGRGRDPNHHH